MTLAPHEVCIKSRFNLRISKGICAMEFNMRVKKFPSWSHKFAALTKRKLLGLKLTSV